MTQKLSIAGLVVAVAASSAFAFGAAPARAACLTSTGTIGTAGYNPCTTFNPDNPSTVNQIQNFTGAGNALNLYTKARVGFRVTGPGITFPVTFGSISIAGSGFTGTRALPGLTVAPTSSGSTLFSSVFLLDSNGGGGNIDFTQNQLTFTIPSITGAASGNSVTAFIQYLSEDEGQVNTANTGASILADPPPVPSPGPLPILGAGAAFGFSRSMRRRIAQSI